MMLFCQALTGVWRQIYTTKRTVTFRNCFANAPKSLGALGRNGVIFVRTTKDMVMLNNAFFFKTMLQVTSYSHQTESATACIHLFCCAASYPQNHVNDIATVQSSSLLPSWELGAGISGRQSLLVYLEYRSQVQSKRFCSIKMKPFSHHIPGDPPKPCLR